MMIRVVEATAEDVDIWRSLRRDGIRRYSNAFMLSLDQHDASDPAVDAERVVNGGKFSAYSGQTPST